MCVCKIEDGGSGREIYCSWQIFSSAAGQNKGGRKENFPCAKNNFALRGMPNAYTCELYLSFPEWFIGKFHPRRIYRNWLDRKLISSASEMCSWAREFNWPFIGVEFPVVLEGLEKMKNYSRNALWRTFPHRQLHYSTMLDSRRFMFIIIIIWITKGMSLYTISLLTLHSGLLFVVFKLNYIPKNPFLEPRH